jgi:hypothetical protein
VVDRDQAELQLLAGRQLVVLVLGRASAVAGFASQLGGEQPAGAR